MQGRQQDGTETGNHVVFPLRPRYPDRCRPLVPSLQSVLQYCVPFLPRVFTIKPPVHFPAVTTRPITPPAVTSIWSRRPHTFSPIPHLIWTSNSQYILPPYLFIISPSNGHHGCNWWCCSMKLCMHRHEHCSTASCWTLQMLCVNTRGIIFPPPFFIQFKMYIYLVYAAAVNPTIKFPALSAAEINCWCGRSWHGFSRLRCSRGTLLQLMKTMTVAVR